MAYPPDALRKAAASADLHVQLRIERALTARTSTRLFGRVERVFRGSPELLNEQVSIEVTSFEGPTYNGPPTGFAGFPTARLVPGRVLEFFADSTPEGPVIPMGLCTLLDAPTPTPQLALQPATTLATHAPARPHGWLIGGILLLLLAGLLMFVGIRLF